MLDLLILEKCRKKLTENAMAGSMISYGDLAAHMGLKMARNIGIYLNRIYEEEMAAGQPDVTLVAVNKTTGWGRFNSLGRPAQSVQFDPTDPDQVALYKAELKRVYERWKSPEVPTAR